MTIALGILAKNGLVIAADSHESRGIYKVDQGKISAVLTATTGAAEAHFRCCAISGSGDGHHIDAVTRQVMECFSNGEAKSAKEVESDCAETIRDFYLKHVAPFGSYPEHERPDFRLLLAAQLPGNRLLVTDKTVLKDASPYVAIGAGEIVAMPLLQRFYQLPLPDVRSAILLAAYVMYHVKETIEGCGKSTDISGIHKGNYFDLRRAETKALEAAAGDYAAWVEPMMLRKLTSSDTEKQRGAASRAQRQLRRLIKAIKLPQ